MSAIPAGYQQTDIGMIPADWESSTIKSLAAPIRNAIVGGPFGSDLVSRDYVDDGVPVIRGRNMGQRWLEGPYVFVTQKKAGALEANLARPGDVIFTQRGTLGQVSLVPDMPYRRYLVSQSQMKVTLNGNIADANFLLCWFVSERGQETIRLNTIQTGVPHINLGILRSLSVPVPPLSEQRAIAAALSDADALIESLEQLVAKKRRVKQGVAQELFTGKRRLPGFSDEWVVKQVGELAEIDADNLGSGTTPDYTFNYISLEDVDQGSLLSYSEQVFFSAPSRARRRLKVGDILVSTVRPNLQSHFLFVSAEPNWICSTGFSVVRCKTSDAVPNYVFFQFFSHAVTKQIEILLTGSSYPAINGSDVMALKIPLPSLPEQIAIGTVVSDMDAEIADLDAQLAKARAIKQGMMHQLLTGKIRLI